MISGWLDYREHGLAVPGSVRAATSAYKADSDAVGRFIEERLLETAMGTEMSSKVFAEWQKWCAANGEEPGSQKAFSEELSSRGYEKTTVHGRARWKGFMLLASEDSEEVGVGRESSV